MCRTKISAEVRQKRVRALEEDIANLDEQKSFKEKRQQQSEDIRNYKLCEEITQEIRLLTQQRRQLYEELSQYREKECKAKWYQGTKGKGKRRMESPSSLSSDASTLVSSLSSAIVDVTSESEVESWNETNSFPQSNSRNETEQNDSTNEAESLLLTDNRNDLCMEDGTSTTDDIVESVFQEGLPVTRQTKQGGQSQTVKLSLLVTLPIHRLFIELMLIFVTVAMSIFHSMISLPVCPTIAP